ncbi:hypothetical protein PsorP6_005981 [Peronosclerospora sorghi]|uniref:Uncharacterized protein n=1 Tax=Peronosclerospora sorghi TaxID=230839 RepID=A0ACC0W4L9_9STRA|nr:hypothetical protein PsorP6_005981 [Peronosclerospora sorghi]
MNKLIKAPLKLIDLQVSAVTTANGLYFSLESTRYNSKRKSVRLVRESWGAEKQRDVFHELKSTGYARNSTHKRWHFSAGVESSNL